MTQWDQYAVQIETAVDAFFSEPVRLMPYKVVGGYTTGAVVDGSRATVDAVGYDVMRRGKGLAGSMLKTQGVGTESVQADLLFKVQDKYLSHIYANDRLQFLDAKRNGLVCEIAYIEPSANGRSTLHLMRIT